MNVNETCTYLFKWFYSSSNQTCQPFKCQNSILKGKCDDLENNKKLERLVDSSCIFQSSEWHTLITTLTSTNKLLSSSSKTKSNQTKKKCHLFYWIIPRTANQLNWHICWHTDENKRKLSIFDFVTALRRNGFKFNTQMMKWN